MSNKLSIKSIRDNEEVILGLLSLLCLFAIVVISLLNDTTYFSVLFDTDEYWPDWVWRIGLFIISIFAVMSCYKGIFLTYASITSHVILLYYYNIFSILISNVTDCFRIIGFSLWWLSLFVSLRYFHLVSQKGKMNKCYYLNMFLFVCALIKYYRLRG